MTSPRPFLSGGRWRTTTQVSRITNPFTQSPVAEVCQAGKAEADEAAAAATAVFQEMRRMPAHARASALVQVARALEDRGEELARTMVGESGKPITDARREVGRAVQTFRIAAEEAKRIPGEVIPLDWTTATESYLGLVRRFPIGPILGITPFNFPLNLVAHKVAPSLACGNPIVIKPAPQTPMTALLLGEVVLGSGFPPAALSVVPCDNSVAEQMVTDDRFKLLSFTGSAGVGWMLKAKAGKKRVLLELGGNAGVIVEPDADLDVAAARCAVGGYAYAGQTCISVQRVLVHETVYEAFLQKLMAHVRALRMGDPSDEGTSIGPLIDEGAARRVEAWVREATEGGARVEAGGRRSGNCVEATVLSQVRPDMKVSCREVFGPVVTVNRYARFEEAVAALNDSDYGLQAGVFTSDVNRIFQAFQALDVGAVIANDIPTFRAEHMPYGGVKDSGLGREGVRYAMEEMTEPRLLVLNLRGGDPS